MGALLASRCCPPASPDEDKIARAHILFSKRKGLFDGFEIWDGGRVAFSYPDQAKRPEAFGSTGVAPPKGRVIQN